MSNIFRNYKLADYQNVADMLTQLSSVRERSGEEIIRTHKNLRKYGPDIRIVGTLNNQVVCYGVGVLDSKVRGGLCMHIEDVAVAKHLHRKGIGSALINHLIEEAKKLGCYKATLTTTSNNIDFYISCGLILDSAVQFSKLLI